LWFRNDWAWGGEVARPSMQATGATTVKATDPDLGERYFACDGKPRLLFTENETNLRRLFGSENLTPHVKDAFHDYLIAGKAGAVNPKQSGTKGAALYKVTVPAGKSEVLRLRLGTKAAAAFGPGFDQTVDQRKKEADEFYGEVIPKSLDADSALVMRQAL